MSIQDNSATGLGDLALAAAESSDIGQDLTNAGSDFGSLLEGIGNALAATQQKLTETSAETTSTLAKTLVDVIAVQETQYRDDGSIANQTSFTQKLPLINFVDPVFYELPQVRVQARFFISEIATATSSTSSSSSQGLGVGLGLSFNNRAFSLGAAGGFTSGSQSSSLSTQTDQVTAVGQVRMFAQISPRNDIGVPKPTQVVTGPSLSIIAGEIKDTDANNQPLKDSDGTPFRTLSVLIQLRNKSGQPIGGKSLSIETDGAPWSYSPPTATTTGATSGQDAGNVTILLKRSFPLPPAGAPPLDTSAQPFIVTARLGLISNSVTVTF